MEKKLPKPDPISSIPCDEGGKRHIKGCPHKETDGNVWNRAFRIEAGNPAYNEPKLRHMKVGGVGAVLTDEDGNAVGVAEAVESVGIRIQGTGSAQKEKSIDLPTNGTFPQKMTVSYTRYDRTTFTKEQWQVEYIELLEGTIKTLSRHRAFLFSLVLVGLVVAAIVR